MSVGNSALGLRTNEAFSTLNNGLGCELCIVGFQENSNERFLEYFKRIFRIVIDKRLIMVLKSKIRSGLLIIRERREKFALFS